MTETFGINLLIMAKPKHIAFIMDGNGRWAQSRGLPRSLGHKAGYERIPTVLEVCIDYDIKVISVFAWSTENWSRPKAEVNYVMAAMVQNLPKFVKELHKRGIRFHHSGSQENISPKLAKAISKAEEHTKHNHNAIFNFVFNYGSRAEITEAVHKIVSETIDPDEISKTMISQNLWSAGLPDVDILVRTGKEKRISNFMMWQCA